MESQIAQLTIQLSQIKSTIQDLANSNSASVRGNNVNTTSNVSYKFTRPLSLGDSGAEVKELQRRLAGEGIYLDEIDGYFGLSTLQAVRAYQKSQGISQLGNVGPGTRAALNR